MAEAITSLFVLEKNKVYNQERWLVLVECPISATQAIRIVHDEANFTWNGKTYYAAGMAVTPNRSNSEGTLESITLTVSNLSGELRSMIEAGNLDGKTVQIRRVHAFSQATDVIQYRFQISTIQMTWDTISFVLAHTNLLNKPMPPNRFLRDICGWAYKSPECGYKGTLPTCDKSLGGANGCRLHGQDEFYSQMPVLHPKRYGGFPGVPDSR